MGWFDEQIRLKIKNDDERFSDSLMEMSGIIMGKENAFLRNADNRTITIKAVSLILEFYHIRPQKIPDSLKEMNDILEYLLRPSGFMKRKVLLKGEWYKDGIGAMLGTYKDSGKAVAIIPAGTQGYEFINEKTGRTEKVRKENANLISEEAYCFYKPLPLRLVTAKDILKYMVQTLSGLDYISIIIASLLVTLLGMITPYANNLIFANAIPARSTSLLATTGLLLIMTAVTSCVIKLVKQVLMAKVKTKMSISIESAVMMRLLSLPAVFFKRYSSGELAGRIQDMNGLCSMITEVIFTVGLSVILSVLNLFQVYAYAPELMGAVAAILLITLVFAVISSAVQTKVYLEKTELSEKERGMVYSIYSGIEKIKVSGAEKRAFSKWAAEYGKSASLEYNPPLFVKLAPVIQNAILLIGGIVIYNRAALAAIDVADYMAFQVSYGMLTGAFSSLVSVSTVFARIKAVLSVISPILSEVPEVSEDKKVVTRLSGGIELNNISFRYKEDMPLIIDNLSLKIRAGQYVAIVGKTGCGKSTLMRLMLGFEKPKKGAVYYDGKDLSLLDLKSLRKFMGVIMQNGKVFPGDIFSNIAVSAPGLTLEKAWEAAEMAGIAEDIRQMPMGMNTIISEDGGGFSRGQKQRLMIARAIASNPKVLLFDEATSALDNITQKKVSDSLSRLKCTRIVIAHRLSTIRECDRIVMLDKGQIVEDGTYDELIRLNGAFAGLVERQKVN